MIYLAATCIDKHNIRIMAIAGHVPNITPPSQYRYQFSLVDFFKENVTVTIDRQLSSGQFINKLDNNEVIITPENSLTQSDGGSLSQFDILLITQGPISPSLIPEGTITGEMILNLIYPANLSLDEVISGGTNDIQWGLPGSHPEIIGKWGYIKGCECT